MKLRQITVITQDVLNEGGRELATPQEAPARLLHLADGEVDVLGIGEAEAEVLDAAFLACLPRPLLERDHVEGPGSLHLDLLVVAVVLGHPNTSR